MRIRSTRVDYVFDVVDAPLLAWPDGTQIEVAGIELSYYRIHDGTWMATDPALQTVQRPHGGTFADPGIPDWVQQVIDENRPPA